MTVAAEPRRSVAPPTVVMHDVPWEYYVQLVELPGSAHLRMTYNRGELEIMPPLPEHDWWKMVISTLVLEMTGELQIRYVPFGSTTWKRRDVAQGLEADDCYYVQHAAQVFGKKRFDLTKDPPPDLAIEIDITSRSISRQPVYAELRVPEVWRFDGRTIQFLVLAPDGSYERSDKSLAFAFLRPADLQRFLDAAETTDQLDLRAQFRQWLRSDVKSRLARGGPDPS